MPRAAEPGLEILFPNSQHLVGGNLGRGKITAKRRKNDVWRKTAILEAKGKESKLKE